ncbi:hypothetical protein DOO78_23475 [Roseicella frigidaeris]|uniref:Uncharacterized protein n=1 Tax=Roseicella frigidaeris TaxID=2230885 RepID=A0A327M175_9PROT|nr:hypothetical protein DOO78_23475 [Roseicella frigidaeris]
MQSQRLSPPKVDPLTRFRLERAMVQVHRLGARACLEAVLEIGVHRHVGDILDALEAFAQLDPAVVRRVGGDRFPVQPLHVVPPTRSAVR